MGLFQFHKGTIKSEMRAAGQTASRLFQFHKGTIKRQGGTPHRSRTYFRFNSIKVRLKGKRHQPNALHHCKFQFHKGTIKSLSIFVVALFLMVSIP